MAVRIGAGLSTELDPRAGAMAAAHEAAAGLGGEPCELAIVFASGGHLAAPEATLEGVHEALSPSALVGCGAGGVLGRGREVEDGTAVSVLALSMEAGRAEPFHAVARPVDDGLVIDGLPPLAGADGVVLVPDPYSFPTDAILHDLRDRAPGVPVMGGVSSARTLDGAGALFFGDEVAEDGAVGLRLEGVETLPCVSQGAAPIGPELEITAADGHVIVELEGAPALERLREVIVGLDEQERSMIGGGLLVGLAVDFDTPDHRQHDFSSGRCSGLIPRRAPSRSVRACARARPCVSMPATRPRPTWTSARPSCCGARHSAAARRLERSCSRATGAGPRCSASPITTPPCSSASSPARRRRDSSRRARSGRSAARTSCTGSPRRWRSSRHRECGAGRDGLRGVAR